ncbi:hypothetical protein CDIK_3779 [Cucumispora dikerogammari]|nr:hypothetical protein CDIK_3779 [Cucumispora dikerogammari]
MTNMKTQFHDHLTFLHKDFILLILILLSWRNTVSASPHTIDIFKKTFHYNKKKKSCVETLRTKKTNEDHRNIKPTSSRQAEMPPNYDTKSNNLRHFFSDNNVLNITTDTAQNNKNLSNNVFKTVDSDTPSIKKTEHSTFRIRKKKSIDSSEKI